MPPGLVLIAGGLLLPLLRGRARGLTVLALPLATLALVWAVPVGWSSTLPFLGWELAPVRGTVAGRLFATIFSITAFRGALRNGERREEDVLLQLRVVRPGTQEQRHVEA